jgi:hypothetical protein
MKKWASDERNPLLTIWEPISKSPVNLGRHERSETLLQKSWGP